MKRAFITLSLLILVGGFVSACSLFGGNSLPPTTTFQVEILNVSTPNTLTTSTGTTSPVPLAPGVYAIHTAAGVFFTNNQPEADNGLEALAEDGDPSILASYVSGLPTVVSSGVFNTPVGESSPGPLLPGDRYQFTFTASPGDRLSFATMFVQSNDLFYAPLDTGIFLYDVNGNPIQGDITSQVFLWDAGTEVNQEPGEGADQAPRQAGPNTGSTENGVVRVVNDGYLYPSINDVIQVTITHVH